MKPMFTRLALAASLAASLLLCGCATTGGIAPEHKPLAQAAVTYATAKVLEGKPERAARAMAIAAEVEALAGGESANTVALVMSLARSKIDFEKLSPADRVLVDALLQAVEIELTKRIGAAPLAGESVLVVKEIAGWIKTGAALAASP